MVPLDAIDFRAVATRHDRVMADLPELRVSPGEARHLLESRIQAGESLRDGLRPASLRGRSGADDAEADFVRWDRYNDLLIRKLFVGEEVSERYRHSKPITMVRSLDDEFNGLDRRLRGALTELSAMVDTLELLDMEVSSTAAAASSSTDRDAYFEELCRRTGGRTDVVVASAEIGETLGLSDAVRSDIEDFLRAEGLIELIAFGPTVRLTHAGRKRHEGAVGRPSGTGSAQTIIVLGDVSGTIQQGREGSSQTLQITSDDAIERARAWLDELSTRLTDGTMAFTSELEAEAADHLELLKSELAKDEPQKPLVRASLRSMGRMLEEAGGGLIATGLLQGLPVILDAL